MTLIPTSVLDICEPPIRTSIRHKSWGLNLRIISRIYGTRSVRHGPDSLEEVGGSILNRSAHSSMNKGSFGLSVRKKERTRPSSVALNFKPSGEFFFIDVYKALDLPNRTGTQQGYMERQDSYPDILKI